MVKENPYQPPEQPLCAETTERRPPAKWAGPAMILALVSIALFFFAGHMFAAKAGERLITIIMVARSVLALASMALAVVALREENRRRGMAIGALIVGFLSLMGGTF